MPSRPLLVDVDTGIDDAIALAYLVARGIDIRAVTTVAGNVPIDVATGNTLQVLSFLDAADIPVHRGASRPLVAPYQDAVHVHGDNGLGGAELPESQAPEQVLAGPAAIIAAAAQHAGELDILTLGPLTNLAIAINVRPEVIKQVRRVVVMGGAFAVGGNVTPHAEFNVYVDPDAANQVFNAGFDDIVAVGLDVTHQTVLSRHLWESIPEWSSDGARLVQDVLRRTFVERDMTGAYMHDPLAAAVALDPTLVSGEICRVTVARDGEYRGQTITTASDSGVIICREVDGSRFGRDFSEALSLPSDDTDDRLERVE